MIHSTSVFTAIFLMASPLFTLEAQDKSVVVKRTQDKPIVVKRALNESTIEFRNSKGEVSKALNVKDANPYKNGIESSGATEPGRKGGHFSTQGLVSNVTDGEAIAVSYSIKVFSAEVEQLQDVGESTLLVYDKTGNEIFKQSIKADNASQPLIAPNAKYVGVYFGGLVHDAVTLKNGFSVYDVSSGSLVYDISTPFMAGAAAFGDIFVFSHQDQGQRQTHYVFDTISGILYKKTYSIEEARYIKRFDNKSIVFLLPPDNERTESYDKHFTIIKR